MIHSHTRPPEPEKPDLEAPERNHYFYGKLMTARDMETEQRYHRNRLHAVSRYVLGDGLICGLSTKIESKRDRLEGTVEPGLALDDRGRLVTVGRKNPVVIKNRKTGEAALPEDDPIYLFLEYSECRTEPVPIPSARDACQEDCCYNRIVEQFTLTYTETEPNEYEHVQEVEFPSAEECENLDHAALEMMAQSYYDEYSAECERTDASSLFLGRFEKRAKDEGWERSDDPHYSPPVVYTNDMLYALIANHVTDFDNPHDVKAIESVNEVGTRTREVTIASERGTISVRTDPERERVLLDISADVVRRKDVTELRETVKDQNDRIEKLEEKLDDLCERLDEEDVIERSEEYDRSDESSEE